MVEYTLIFKLKDQTEMQKNEFALKHKRRLESVPQTNHGIKSDIVTWVRLQNKACLRSLEGDTITSSHKTQLTHF